MEKLTSKSPKGTANKKHFIHRLSLTHIMGRFNQGSFTLTYTTKSHPVQFEGKLSVLINGGTASAASNLASSLKEWSNAHVVGEESGGGYRGCNSGNLILQLPNSKMRVVINVFKAINTTVTTYESDGVSPHMQILDSDDFTSEEDMQMNYILETLIKAE